jgi:hypothetical protein
VLLDTSWLVCCFEKSDARQGDAEALTTDRHFEQESFVRVLPP